MVGKQTWTKEQASKGYHTVKTPEFKPAFNTMEHSGGGPQRVKGIGKGKRPPSEAAPAAGRKQ